MSKEIGQGHNFAVMLTLVLPLPSLQSAIESRLGSRHRFGAQSALTNRAIYFGFPIVIPVTRNEQIRDARRLQTHAFQLSNPREPGEIFWI